MSPCLYAPAARSASCLSGWTPILDDRTSFRHSLLHCNRLCTHAAAADAIGPAIEYRHAVLPDPVREAARDEPPLPTLEPLDRHRTRPRREGPGDRARMEQRRDQR